MSTAPNESAGRQPGATRKATTEESTPCAVGQQARRGAAYGVASRRWPSCDPIDFARREAIKDIAASDRALGNAIDLREAANEIAFPDLERLRIHPSRTEILLSLELASLRDAARHMECALDLLTGARRENKRRFCDNSTGEQQEGRAG
jgi:hypothetical protein